MKYNLDRSLSGAAVNQMGILSATLELGPRRAIDMQNVNIGLDAVMQMLDHLQMVHHTPQKKDNSKGALQRSKSPFVHKEGVFIPKAPLGVILPKGTFLGTHYDKFGTVLQQIQMPQKGVVLSFPDTAYLSKHQSCATLATYE